MTKRSQKLFLICFLICFLANSMKSSVNGQENNDARNDLNQRLNSPEIWFGPPSFVAGSAKEDFIDQITHSENYPTLFPRIKVFKLYIEMFNYYNDQELKQLIDFFNENQWQIAIETGGLRAYQPYCYSLDMGKTTYAVEGKRLRRWQKLGGRVDYVVIDHAVPLLMSDLLRGTNQAPIPDDFRKCMTWQKGCQMLADYFVLLIQDFPETKIALADSLAYFTIVGRDGTLWKSTDPRLVDLFSFSDYIDYLIGELKTRNITLDHFQIDHGMEVAVQDKFQRIFGVEDYCQKIGLKTAMILNNVFINNDPRQDKIENNREKKIQSIYEWLPKYVAGYFQGGHSPILILQRWQTVPIQTGPESEPNSVMGIARSTLEQESFPKIQPREK